MVTAVTSKSSPQPHPNLPPPATSSRSTSHPVNPDRGPHQTRHQAVVSQGARFKANRPVTSQAVVQLPYVLDEVTEELQCKESAGEASSMEEVHQRISGIPQ